MKKVLATRTRLNEEAEAMKAKKSQENRAAEGESNSDETIIEQDPDIIF
jgi:hypothetical protein